MSGGVSCVASVAAAVASFFDEELLLQLLLSLALSLSWLHLSSSSLLFQNRIAGNVHHFTIMTCMSQTHQLC